MAQHLGDADRLSQPCVCAGGSSRYLALQPDGPGRTRIRYGAALAPEVLAAQADPQSYIAGTKAFLDAVQLEDKQVVGEFLPAQRPALRMLSWLERKIMNSQYLARRLSLTGAAKELGA